MEKPKYEIKAIDKNSESFIPLCQKLDEEITTENLRDNGGTLRFSTLIYKSDVLLVAYEGEEPVGYNSLIMSERGYYINQIAVKKSHQHQGVGSTMMKVAIEMAAQENKDVVAHVMNYNEASKGMFLSLGFKKIEERNENGLYILKQKKLFFRRSKV